MLFTDAQEICIPGPIDEGIPAAGVVVEDGGEQSMKVLEILVLWSMVGM